jgi:hypothetical protein
MTGDIGGLSWTTGWIAAGEPGIHRGSRATEERPELI